MLGYGRMVSTLATAVGGEAASEIWGFRLETTHHHIDGLVQERRNSIANALELRRLSCTNLSTWRNSLTTFTLLPVHGDMSSCLLHTKKQGKSEGFDSCDRPSNPTQTGFKSSFFSPCDLEIWWMTLKNNRAPHLCCFQLYAWFHSHQWIQTKVTVRKRLIRVKISDFF